MGEVTSVDASLLRTLVDSDYIPVVASVAADTSGQALNVNADIAAGEVLSHSVADIFSVGQGAAAAAELHVCRSLQRSRRRSLS